MLHELEKKVTVEDAFNFNGPEDDAEDSYDDDFAIEDIESIGEFGDFDDVDEDDL